MPPRHRVGWGGEGGADAFELGVAKGEELLVDGHCGCLLRFPPLVRGKGLVRLVRY